MNIAFARPPYQRQAINHFVPSIYYATLEIAHSRGRRFYTWLSWLNRYFLGLFQEVSNNDEWKAFNRHFFEVLINNGDVFVSYNKGIFYLWEVKRIYYNGAQVVAIDATLFQPDGDLEKDAKIYTFLNNIHGVYVNFIDRHYKGLIFNWSDHIDTFIMLENNFLNSARFDTKKYELHYLGNDEIELEQYISRITNSADPFIRIITDLDADNPMNIRIKPLETGQMASKSETAHNNLVNYITYIFNNEGLAVPTELKKERKTTSEAKLDIYNTYNTEGIIKRNLDLFSFGISKLYGINLKFDRNVDLTVIDNEGDIINGNETNEGEF